jgi:2-methylcitrate dehydratase PrpD
MLAPNTLDGVLDLAAIAPRDIPQSARSMARLSLFDWMVVARAGATQPVAKVVGDYVVEEGGKALFWSTSQSMMARCMTT